MYRHILVPLDGSLLAEEVLLHVQSMARLDEDVRITLLRAVPPVHSTTVEFGGMYSGAMSPAAETVRAEHTAREYLDTVAAKLRAEGFHVSTELSRLNAADAIVDYAEHHNVDLIAIATHGRSGVSRWVFGSVTQKVMQAAPAPMLVVRPHTPQLEH
jgi:nucleotide-binding universal stress UspA family protein